ncbi:MAG: hypothetical protein INR71_11740 [Terriglobus roseus]|nr:hypothetical protein [Terriglobus roseus]
MKSFAIALAALGLAHSALATVAFSAPVASSNLKGGSSYKLQWRDDGVAPSLATFGQATFSLGVGGSVQQVLLQQLGTADVSKVSSLTINIDPDVGQNAQGSYFIRADSTTKDPSSQYGAPYQVPSAAAQPTDDCRPSAPSSTSPGAFMDASD